MSLRRIPQIPDLLEISGCVRVTLVTLAQVAEQLLVAPRTIETHLEHIFAKLGVQTRTELGAWAARGDVVTTPATSVL